MPAVSLPLHWTADGLPVGVMLAARPAEEELLLALSRAGRGGRALGRPEAARMVTGHPRAHGGADQRRARRGPRAARRRLRGVRGRTVRRRRLGARPRRQARAGPRGRGLVGARLAGACAGCSMTDGRCAPGTSRRWPSQPRTAGAGRARRGDGGAGGARAGVRPAGARPTDDGVPLYECRGWLRWRGRPRCWRPPASVPHSGRRGLASTSSGGGPLDLDGELTCDWRDGDLW